MYVRCEPGERPAPIVRWRNYQWADLARAFNIKVLANVVKGILMVDEANILGIANRGHLCQLLSISVDRFTRTLIAILNK